MSRPLFYDRAKETTTTTGTGTLTLAGAASGYQSFAAVGNGNKCVFCIEGQTTAEWEVAVGTYTAAGTTLSRDEVLASSNSGAAVSLSAGTKNVFLVNPAAFSGPQLCRPGGRLTLTTATPVTTADVTGAATVYYTPYLHDMLELYDGFAWRPASFAELSLAASSVATSFGTKTGNTTNGSATVSSMSNTTSLYEGMPVTGTGIVAGTTILSVDSSSQVTLSANANATNSTVTLTFYHANYDIFALLSSGAAALASLAWTDNTTRATALTYLDGRLVKSGDTGKLYLGTVRLSGSAAAEDSVSRRYVWNMYNRVPRHLYVTEATDTWTYTTDAWRAANGSGANSVRLVLGLDEGMVRAQVAVNAFNSPTGAIASPGVGVDSTTANSAQVRMGHAPSVYTALVCSYRGWPGVGYHRVYWLERSQAAGTTTWNGDEGSPNIQACGMGVELEG
jgi:hypothetical protein